MNYYKYNVAGNIFELILDDGLVNDKFFYRYKPFEIDNGTALFSMQVIIGQIEMGKLEKRIGEEAPFLWLYKNEEGKYQTGFSLNEKSASAILDGTTLYIIDTQSNREVESCVNNALMFLYTQYSSQNNTLLLHASVVNHNGYGYMFLGRSGTGKSTHSQLWLDNINNTELLNDDNPIIKIVGEEIFVSGSPWSGKTPCYKNEQIPLRGIVRLSQAKQNQISHLNNLQAFAALLPSCATIKWNKFIEDSVYHSILNVIKHCRIWNLECLPNNDAAILCNNTIK